MHVASPKIILIIIHKPKNLNFKIKIKKIINITPKFLHFINDIPKFFQLSIVTRAILRFITVIFSNFFCPKSTKTVKIYLFLLFFNLKHLKN